MRPHHEPVPLDQLTEVKVLTEDAVRFVQLAGSLYLRRPRSRTPRYSYLEIPGHRCTISQMSKRVKYDLLTYPESNFATSVVASHYQITDGMLHRVEPGRAARTYNPFQEVSLPTALARISSGELSSLEFAAQFGELGYSRMIRNRLAPSFSASFLKSAEWKTAHVAYQNWQKAFHRATRAMPTGDPVDWISAHSKTVALCLEFIGLLTEGDEEAIREALEDVPRGPYAWGVHLCTLPVKEWRQSLRTGVRASAIIRLALCHLVNENIAGIRRWLVTNPHASRAESFFLCSATIEAVYWQLADRMEARMIQRCAECQRFFVARDKRQQYCPPLPGSTRSRCSSRLNVRNLRLRQRLPQVPQVHTN